MFKAMRYFEPTDNIHKVKLCLWSSNDSRTLLYPSKHKINFNLSKFFNTNMFNL